jgi:hypothetical protein
MKDEELEAESLDMSEVEEAEEAADPTLVSWPELPHAVFMRELEAALQERDRRVRDAMALAARYSVPGASQGPQQASSQPHPAALAESAEASKRGRKPLPRDASGNIVRDAPAAITPNANGTYPGRAEQMRATNNTVSPNGVAQ